MGFRLFAVFLKPYFPTFIIYWTIAKWILTIRIYRGPILGVPNHMGLRQNNLVNDIEMYFK